MRKNYISRVFLAFAIFFSLQLNAQSKNLVPVDTGIYFYEDFEGDISSWTIEGGFEIGNPTSGPDSAAYGNNCAATNLSGNYGSNMVYSLTTPLISIPENASNVNLSFLEYYYLEGSNDWIYIQISIDGGMNWSNLSGGRSGNNSAYVPYSISLNSYRGENVRIRFRMTTNSSWNYAGWYIDEVRVSGDNNIPSRDVPYLAVITEDGTIMTDTTIIAEDFSTQEPWIGDAIVANLSTGDTLIIDSIVSTSPQLQVSKLDTDTIISFMGTPSSISYQPTAVGAVSDTLIIFSNDTASPMVIIFEGEAYEKYYKASPELLLNGEVLPEGNFNNPVILLDTALQREETYDTVFSFQLVNRGIYPVDLFNYYNKYAGNSAFSIISWSDLLIETNDTATIELNFEASRARQQIVGLTYEFFDSEGERVIRTHWFGGKSIYDGSLLEYDGAWSQVDDSLFIDFGLVEVGSMAQSLGLKLKNLGNIPLDISMRIVGDDFAYVGESPIHLNPGQGNEEDEGVSFTPSDSVGFISGLLIFEHNDTTTGTLDTVYLRGKGYKPNVYQSAELTLYFDGVEIERDSTLELEFEPQVINNDYEDKWFAVVNTGQQAGFFDLNNVDNYFYWVDENNNTFNNRSNIFVPAGDTIKFRLRFDPGHDYIFEYITSIYFRDDSKTIYLKPMGYGLKRHGFLVRYNGSRDVNEYNGVSLYNYTGFADTTEYTYYNLNETGITIDSIVIEDNDETTRLLASNLPVTLEPGETYNFHTIFDPIIPDGMHQSTIKIYSTNLTEPIWIFYVNNNAVGSPAIEFELLTDNVSFNGGDDVRFGEVSSIDGSRNAGFRILNFGGYDLLIDSVRIQKEESLFAFQGIEDNSTIRLDSTKDFDLTYTPRDTSGYTNDELVFYFNFGMGFNIDLSGSAIDERNHAAELGVHAGGTDIANGGNIDFGSIPTNGGLENIILSLTNPGVQYITVDSILFSNPSFSLYNDGNGVYDVFEVWYYGAEMLTVYFEPEEHHVNEGTMTIYSDDPTNPEYVINLRGTGSSGLEETKAGSFEIYPNPASDFIQINAGIEGEYTIEIYNSNGSMVYSDINTDNETINITDLEKGVYVVRINQINDNKIVKLVIE